MKSEQLTGCLKIKSLRFVEEHKGCSPASVIYEAMMTGALIALEMSREDDAELLRGLNAGLPRKDYIASLFVRAKRRGLG